MVGCGDAKSRTSGLMPDPACCAAGTGTTSPGRLRWGCCLGYHHEHTEYKLLWEIGDKKGHILQGLLSRSLFRSSVAGCCDTSVFRVIQPYSSVIAWMLEVRLVP